MKTITFDEEFWQLVPHEPTQEMVEIGAGVIDDNGGNARWSDIRETWSAMLSAAPQPSEQTAHEHCKYPDCNCPFDAPADPNWCARGLKHQPQPGEQREQT